MTDTLLDKARRWISTAEFQIGSASDDEFYLSLAAFSVQKCVEMCLKHLMEVDGVPYPNTSDIALLLSAYNFSKLLPASVFKDLTLGAGTLTAMETKTRYIKNYRLSRDLVMVYYSVALELLKATAKAEGASSSGEFRKMRLE